MAFLLDHPIAAGQALDSNGRPLPGAKLYVYDAGTTDDANTFSDTALSAAHAQPVVADSAGRFANIYVAGGQSYKLSLKTSADAAVVERDNLPPGSKVSGTLAINEGGTNATTAAGALTSLGAAAAADLTTVTSTVTTIANERTALPGSAFNDLAGLDLLTSDYMSGIKEVCIQRSIDDTPSATSISTSLPSDASTPLITEGTEVFSIAFTPLRADTTLEITSVIEALVATNSEMSVAIFAGSACIAATSVYGTSGGAQNEQFILTKRYAPGSTSAITISVRAGYGTGAATQTINSKFSAVANSFLEIKEMRAT